MAELAAQHLPSIRKLLTRPACLLAGVGCGAVVAHELGVQLQSAGIEVSFVLLGSSMCFVGFATRDTAMSSLLSQRGASSFCS